MVYENDQISSAVLTTSIVITIVVIQFRGCNRKFGPDFFIVNREKQSDAVNHLNFKIRLFDLTEFIVWNIYVRSSTLGYKDIEIRESEVISRKFSI